MTSQRVFVVGVGMTKFLKPPTKLDYDDMGAEAAANAIKDAGIDYASVQAAACGYCYGDPTCGQRALYKLGLTGVPIVNVNNNCSTGSTALFVARTFVQSGTDCVLAVGFEKMQPGNLTQKFEDTHQSPTAQHFDVMYKLGAPKAKVSPAMNQFTEDVLKLFACAQQEHMEKYGSKSAHYNQVAYKNHKQSTLNPLAVMSKELPLSFIEKSGTLCGPLLRAHACPVASGAAAAVVCSERFVKKHGLEDKAVEIVGQSMVTDMPSSFQSSSFISLSGFEMAQKAAQNVFSSSGVKPNQVGVVECHNCFSCNELFMYEALGFTDIGNGGAMIESGQWVKGKKGGELFYLKGKNCRPAGVVFNPSGGLECKGHPIGATGLAQCCELNWQLRGMCGPRQVEGAEYALQQNFGIGGAAVVTLYKRPRSTIKSSL